MGPFLASHAVRSGAGRAWNWRGRTSRVGGEAIMVIASENGAMVTESIACGYVPITRTPEQRPIPPGRISQGMVGCHEPGQGARRLQEARSLRRYRIPLSPSCQGNPWNDHKVIGARHKHANAGKAS